MTLSSFKKKPSSTQHVSTGGAAPVIRASAAAFDQVNTTISSSSIISSQANTIKCSSSPTPAENPCKDIILLTPPHLSSFSTMTSASLELGTTTHVIMFST